MTKAAPTIKHPIPRRLALAGSAILALALASCATAPNQPDFVAGTWDGESLAPPSGLLDATQGPLVGRAVYNNAGTSPLSIVSVLVEPAQGQPRYAVLASQTPSPGVVIVPVNALRIGPTAVQLTATDYTLEHLPNYRNIAALEVYFPHTVITPVAGSPPPAPMSTLPPVMPPPVPGAGVTAPLQIARYGSVVGEAAVDAAGTPLGQITAVAVVPGTGEVRFAVIAGPSIGAGYFIAVPAGQAQAEPGRVVVAGTAVQWMTAPRYRADQLPQAIGAIGMLY